MRFRAALIVLLLSLMISSAAQTGSPDKLPDASSAKSASAGKPVDVSTDSHFKLVFHNEYTNVYRLDLNAGEQTYAKFPHGFLRISLSNSTISANPATDLNAENVGQGQGDSFPSGGDCFLKNLGGTTYSAIFVEVLKGKISPKLPDGTPFMGHMAPTDTSVAADPFDLGAILLNAVDVPPGKATKWHTHKYPHLLIVVSEMEMKVETKGAAPQDLELEPGTVKWVAPITGEHRLVNTAKETPEDPKKKLEREREREREGENERDEAGAMYVSVEFK